MKLRLLVKGCRAMTRVLTWLDDHDADYLDGRWIISIGAWLIGETCREVGR